MASSSLYGTTPWGDYFLQAILQFDESGRLNRGKSYANTGKVTAIAIEKTVVTAKVRGHSSPFYRVRIEFPVLEVQAREKLYRLIDNDPMLLSRIQAGELPEELIKRMHRAGFHLVPSQWTDMKRSCSCPDWGDPCKHMAAVYYMLAREIDRNPFVLFSLRGVDLRERAGESDGESDIPTPLALKKTRKDRRPSPLESEPCFDSFNSYIAFITALLPPRQSFTTIDFKTALVEFYHYSSRRKESLIRPHDESVERLFSGADFEVVTRGRLPGLTVLVRHPAAARLKDLLVHARMRPLPDPAVTSRGTVAIALSPRDGLELFLGFASPVGSEGYRFLYFFFRLVYAVIGVGAFSPSPSLEAGRLSILWRVLPAAKDAIAALDSIGASMPSTMLSGYDGPSAAVLLAAGILTDYVISLGFVPGNAKASSGTAVSLFFGGEIVGVAGFAERSLPRAVDSWLAALSLQSGEFRYSFVIGSARRKGTKAYVLSVRVRRGDEVCELMEAAARFSSIEPLRLPSILSPYLEELRLLSTKKTVTLDAERLGFFLEDSGPILSRMGIEVELPKELRDILKPRLVLTARAKAGNLSSYLQLNDLLSYTWRVAIGEETLSLAEFEDLVAKKERIVHFRDSYVRLDPGQAARLLEGASALGKPEGIDAVRSWLTGETVFSADTEALFESLFRERTVPVPSTLTATLRPYQERGFLWALSNLMSGFGCILADDMGLGKTVEAIAVMLALKEAGLLGDGALVVAPASLLVNWERELARFAPTLAVVRYHGLGRSVNGTADVFLTTYQTSARDGEALSSRRFSLLLLDEAHTIKNAKARQTQASKSISSAYRLALSGTPVENNLEELRSIFDFVLPGYLGSAKDFAGRFRVPIEVERNAEASSRLKAITAPFLLRRLKSDRSIIADLPDKVVADEYSNLTTAQAALYEGVVRQGLEEAERAEREGMGALARGAIVLKLLTSLKQVCDHPALYDRESPRDAVLSGKCVLLLGLLEQVLERREKVLVFSQYVGALELLAETIRDNLGEEPLLFHGGMGTSARSSAVDEFQGSDSRRIFLVSLKAGGVGLNLTAASRVVHYDLWYNPAVENQATDRAFRIGQTRNVFVHRFITAGTFEERIDAMLKSKRELADLTVASGETWIGKMPVDDLRRLFTRDRKEGS